MNDRRFKYKHTHKQEKEKWQSLLRTPRSIKRKAIFSLTTFFQLYAYEKIKPGIMIHPDFLSLTFKFIIDSLFGENDSFYSFQ